MTKKAPFPKTAKKDPKNTVRFVKVGGGTHALSPRRICHKTNAMKVTKNPQNRPMITDDLQGYFSPPN
jgi:hypothetical protein